MYPNIVEIVGNTEAVPSVQEDMKFAVGEIEKRDIPNHFVEFVELRFSPPAEEHNRSAR